MVLKRYAFGVENAAKGAILATMLLMLQMFSLVTNCYDVLIVPNVRIVTVVMGGLCLK